MSCFVLCVVSSEVSKLEDDESDLSVDSILAGDELFYDSRPLDAPLDLRMCVRKNGAWRALLNCYWL